MKTITTEIVFAVCCAALCAAMLWCASKLGDGFYTCACVFTAAFWGSLAAFVVWGRISMERERREPWQPSIIWRR